ncbi:hypothetical protein CTEN210_18700 [Chaetoceros tenuissimus]|uniref:Transposable element P transposase-like RNase H domain-containing protein n=1 Tax=Chaetoceros tenuissimus TaxID=426638 RepID=A0AAD3HGC7_9STRA|nr:hypothetical protein CTEN210_18700 [Chaetoceros tenuissimus]
MERTSRSRRAKPTNMQVDNRLTGRDTNENTSKNDIEFLKENNYSSVPVIDDHEDAAIFTDQQLQFIRDVEPERWQSMDMVHLSDDQIKRIVLDGKKLPADFTVPLVKRRNSIDIKSFSCPNNSTKAMRKKLEQDSDAFLHELLSTGNVSTGNVNQHNVNPFKCMGITKNILVFSSGKSKKADIEETEKYEEELEVGFEIYVRKALRAKEVEIKAFGDSSRRLLLDPSIEGFLLSNEEKLDSEPFLYLKYDKTRRGDEDNIHNCYYFCAPCCASTGGPSKNQISCDDCASTFRDFRRKCVRKAQSKAKGYAKQRKDSISSPSQVKIKLSNLKKDLRNTKERAKYFQDRYDNLLKKHGMDVTTADAKNLFNQETNDGYNKVLDSLTAEKSITLKQKELISYLCMQSMRNVLQAQMSGKKTVKFCPIIIKFATYLRSKMNNSSYEFLAAVSGWPSARTLQRYGGSDTNATDGICHETLDEVKNAFFTNEKEEWEKMVSLSFDEFKIKEKLIQNAHTLEIIGFTEQMNDINVLVKELEEQTEQTTSNETNNLTPNKRDNNTPKRASHMLIFMMIRWDDQGDPFKRVVARYAVKGSKGESLVRKVKHVIRALATRDLIVNNVTSDGASENMSCFKQLATYTAKEIWPNLNPSLPGEFKVAFDHPSYPCKIFIGGEMAHWVKKLVNALESSSSTKKERDLTKNGKKINLKMIETAWRDQLGGISSLRSKNCPLTVDHFEKNSFNRMKSHIALQTLSKRTHDLILDYCKNDPGKLEEYSSLLKLIEYTNNMVDIWNHKPQKTFKGLDGEENRFRPLQKVGEEDLQDHEYIKYLEEFLLFFVEWKDEEFEGKSKYHFIPNTLYESFCYLVFGLKGVAAMIPEGRKMIHNRGGTDIVENEIGRVRQGNSNPGAGDAIGMIATGNNTRMTTFTRNAKGNVSEQGINSGELCSKPTKRRKTGL